MAAGGQVFEMLYQLSELGETKYVSTYILNKILKEAKTASHLCSCLKPSHGNCHFGMCV